jgi:metal-responsive CopG/Arc/MetJ family transcriptional regulator
VNTLCDRYGMQRTTIMLPEDVAQRLRQIAAERGTSMAALLRDAAEEQVRRYRPRPRILGIGEEPPIPPPGR